MKTLKKTPLFAAFILLCGAGISQNNVTTLRFTASTQGHYTQLDSVATHSITEQWSETIVYPDTVLALENAQVGLTQATDVELGISSYPNPFGGKTHIGISVAKPEVAGCKTFSKAFRVKFYKIRLPFVADDFQGRGKLIVVKAVHVVSQLNQGAAENLAHVVHHC